MSNPTGISRAQKNLMDLFGIEPIEDRDDVFTRRRKLERRASHPVISRKSLNAPSLKSKVVRSFK